MTRLRSCLPGTRRAPVLHREIHQERGLRLSRSVYPSRGPWPGSPGWDASTGGSSSLDPDPPIETQPTASASLCVGGGGDPASSSSRHEMRPWATAQIWPNSSTSRAFPCHNGRADTPAGTHLVPLGECIPSSPSESSPRRAPSLPWANTPSSSRPQPSPTRMPSRSSSSCSRTTTTSSTSSEQSTSTTRWTASCSDTTAHPDGPGRSPGPIGPGASPCTHEPVGTGQRFSKPLCAGGFSFSAFAGSNPAACTRPTRSPRPKGPGAGLVMSAGRRGLRASSSWSGRWRAARLPVTPSARVRDSPPTLSHSPLSKRDSGVSCEDWSPRDTCAPRSRTRPAPHLATRTWFRVRTSEPFFTLGGPLSRSGPPPLSSNSLPRPSLPGGPDLTLNRSTRPLSEG